MTTNPIATLTVYRGPERLEGVSVALVDTARGTATALVDTRAPGRHALEGGRCSVRSRPRGARWRR